MTKIAISLEDEVVRELAQLAREEQLSEDALVREAVERLVQSRHAPAVPRFARRVGPLVIQGATR
jgi:predicted transcriptional regulator